MTEICPLCDGELAAIKSQHIVACNSSWRHEFVCVNNTFASAKAVRVPSKELDDILSSYGILTGEAAKQFEEYNNRPATKEEIKSMKRAHKFYKEHSDDLTNEDIDWLLESLDPNIDDGYCQSVIDKLEKMKY